MLNIKVNTDGVFGPPVRSILNRVVDHRRSDVPLYLVENISSLGMRNNARKNESMIEGDTNHDISDAVSHRLDVTEEAIKDSHVDFCVSVIVEEGGPMQQTIAGSIPLYTWPRSIWTFYPPLCLHFYKASGI